MRNERLLRFGTSVRTVRSTLGLSQRALGKRIGRSQAYMSLLERGMIARLSIVEAERVCSGLGATLVLGVRHRSSSRVHVNVTPHMRVASHT